MRMHNLPEHHLSSISCIIYKKKMDFSRVQAVHFNLQYTMKGTYCSSGDRKFDLCYFARDMAEEVLVEPANLDFDLARIGVEEELEQAGVRVQDHPCLS